MDNKTRVLVVAGFSIWVDGEPRTGKIDSHVQPIADVADEVHFVNIGPKSSKTEGITYHQVKPTRWKIITILKQLCVSFWLSFRKDFDLIVSFSLIPRGISGLLMKLCTRTPVHLAIVGADLDIHARAWYGFFIQWCFRRFDTISVKGSNYERQLLEYDVPQKRIFSLFNPPPIDFQSVEPSQSPKYDILWLTRMAPEKNPFLFLEILSELCDRDVSFTAAMVGGGPLEKEIEAAITRQNLEGIVHLPGWSDNPIEFYENSNIYILTSDRDMLPVSLLEAMYCETAPVCPAIGAIPDIIEHNENGFLVDEQNPKQYANYIEQLLKDKAELREAKQSAFNIRSDISREEMAKTWTEIIAFVQQQRAV